MKNSNVNQKTNLSSRIFYRHSLSNRCHESFFQYFSHHQQIHVQILLKTSENYQNVLMASMKFAKIISRRYGFAECQVFQTIVDSCAYQP